MAKFSGIFGFAIQIEINPGIWVDQIIERKYKGDIFKNNRKYDIQNNKINDNFKIDNQISVISDAYLFNNIPTLRYIKWMNANWKVNSIEINRPRIIITLGDIYNAVAS